MLSVNMGVQDPPPSTLRELRRKAEQSCRDHYLILGVKQDASSEIPCITPTPTLHLALRCPFVFHRSLFVCL